ncbi:SIS domain-containing protein [Streptomyces milbemycinicus]|uniref:Glutamine--fructose-6-phosphate aminotransferase [isomerizing] n=1 Tax=Streptomyces milbemycinicus TaxID=476552 RepID=A0ABW8LZT5_9ACTN
MTDPVRPEVMLRQAEALADDIRAHAGAFDEQVCSLLPAELLAKTESVDIVGDGDSYHAARAVEMAFESLAGVDCRPVSALPFTHYERPGASRPPHARLTIAVSASGRTPLVVRSAEQARRAGATVVALTGTPDSPLTRSADAAVLVGLPGQEPSPGVRTYQAGLLGALLIAVRLGQARGRLDRDRADTLRGELVQLAGAVEETVRTVGGPCRELAERIADAPVLTVLGSGPSHGTALYSAAKVIETSGVFAAGQDLEEWCHVERFACPTDMPTFVVAPPGHSSTHAHQVIRRAAALGRRVVAIAPADDLQGAREAWAALPVRGQVREEFSPLLYHLYAAPLACHLAQRLERMPFAAGRPPHDGRQGAGP